MWKPGRPNVGALNHWLFPFPLLPPVFWNGCPVVGSRNSVLFPLPLNLNIELIDPAIESNDPGILGSAQLSSMTLSTELKSVDLATYRREHAGPVLQSFADWLAAEVPRVLPKSKIGEAVGYAAN